MPTMLRFAVVRPFQKRSIDQTRTPRIPSQSSQANTALYKTLKAAHTAGDRDAMFKAAKDHRSAEAIFQSGFAGLKTPLAALDGFLLSHPAATFSDLGSRAAESVPKGEEWITSPAAMAERVRLHDALLACAIDSERKEDVLRLRPVLIRYIRICEALLRIASDDETIAVPGALDVALRAIVLLPGDLFPLPTKDTSSEIATLS